MNTLLIGLGYKARHGKDTIAKIAARDILDARVMSHADDLKALARALGMTEKHGPFLQKLGEAMRTLDQDYFVKKLHLRIDEIAPRVVLIPDVRFPNEADAIKARGGLLYHVERRLPNGTLYVDASRDPNHPSETAMDGYQGWNRSFSIMDGDTGGLMSAAHRVVADALVVIRDRQRGDS